MKAETEDKKTIILVDSYSGSRKAYGQFIHTDLGHKVLRTESAERAYDLFKRRSESGKPVDMIITDVQRKNDVDGGIELCRKVRAYELSHHKEGKPFNIPFILQTQWLSFGYEKQVIEGKLKLADGVAGKAALVPKNGVEVLETAIESAFAGRFKG